MLLFREHNVRGLLIEMKNGVLRLKLLVPDDESIYISYSILNISSQSFIISLINSGNFNRLINDT